MTKDSGRIAWEYYASKLQDTRLYDFLTHVSNEWLHTHTVDEIHVAYRKYCSLLGEK